MKTELKSEDYENFNKLEDELLSLNADIKYSRDFEMESKIMYDSLCDQFNKDDVDLFLHNNNIEIKSLIDLGIYSNICESLKL